MIINVYLDYQIGSECTRNFECTLPFTACIGGRCQCVAGTSVSGSVCIASNRLWQISNHHFNNTVCASKIYVSFVAPNCPTGAKSKGVCVRTSGNKSLIQNLPNSGGKIDNCPDNHYCYTADVTEYGVCCPEVCPLNMRPDNKYSCDPSAADQCPYDTHYCSRLAGKWNRQWELFLQVQFVKVRFTIVCKHVLGQTFSSSVCCPKPCRGPTPLFIKGQCYPVAYLGGSCTVDEQCDGGYGMTCTNNVCVCSQGFKPYSDSFISGENPPQTCVRDCKSSSKPNAISYNGECFPPSGLQQECTVNEQCPKNSICNRGLCICDCTKGFTTENGGCIRPTTTTSANTTPKPLLGPSEYFPCNYSIITL